MKKSIALAILVLPFLSCSSTRFIDSWKSDEIGSFTPDKLLVVGMTENLTARRIFEENLKLEFKARGINAYESSGVLDQSFTETRRTEEEIEAMSADLLAKGFDAVIISAVIGVDEKTNYSPGYYDVGYRWYRFGRYYYRYQDIYYNPGYYDDYRVYHVETSIYNLRAEAAKALVWVGTFDIVDPHGIRGTVEGYVGRIVKQLESEQLISRP